MVDYIPIEDMNPYILASSQVQEVDRFHLFLPLNGLFFFKAYESYIYTFKNIGLDNLNFNGLKTVGNMQITEDIPNILLAGHEYYFTVTQGATAIGAGCIYIDVGDSYGNKLINITGVIE